MEQVQLDFSPELRDLPVASSSSAENGIPGVLVSLGLHLAAILTAGFITISLPKAGPSIELITELTREIPLVPLRTDSLPVYDIPTEQVGAESSTNAISMSLARSMAPTVAPNLEAPPPELLSTRLGDVDPSSLLTQATGEEKDAHIIVRGAGGVGTTTARGAIDRLTHEILLSLEERPTVVVWLFDQSPSLNRQRREIWERLDRVYKELATVQSSGSTAFRGPVTPLLSSVIAFGENVTLRTKEPTADIEEVRKVIREIDEDTSGIENAFSAVRLAIDRSKKFRKGTTREPKRNVMLIVFSDEVGDDQQLLDATVSSCQRWEIPVYVVGVPAPFGQQETLVKWVDPDPQFNQTPQWGRVSQGPETLLPERLRLDFEEAGDDLSSIDSGFGPFALTRLCVETGGIYFAVHPNRRVGERVGAREIEAFSSHLTFFFSSDVMRKYRPEYTSAKVYQQHVAANKARQAVLEAARVSWLAPMSKPETHFVRRDEAQFASDLFEAQKKAAKLEPEINRLYEILKLGEADRDREDLPRWQAGYDLAMGRVLAIKVRTESYNAMLAQAKRGMNPKDPKDNTFTLQKSDKVLVGSQLEALAEKGKLYLQRVVSEHIDTPWALLAQRELETPLGWEWRESFTPLTPPEEMMNPGNPPPRRDEQRRMLDRPLPTRPVPRL